MELTVTPISMVDHSGRQLIRIGVRVPRTAHFTLNAVCPAEGCVICSAPAAMSAGESTAFVRLPAPDKDINVLWEVLDERGDAVISLPALWKKPREWTFYNGLFPHGFRASQSPVYTALQHRQHN
jgi:hypothetical protein